MTAKKPGYREIAASLREAITLGRLTAGDTLPTLVELMAEWDVSRVTVRRAVKVLEAEGWVSARGGRRTTVNPASEVPCPDWAAEMWDVPAGGMIRAWRINGSIILRRHGPA